MNTYPAWSGTKRNRCPLWLWEFVMSSRVMGWPGFHRILRWAVNKTNKTRLVYGVGGVIGTIKERKP